MASSVRMERLRKLVQADVDALPDRAVSPEADSASVGDSEGTGGVSLELEQSKTSPNEQIPPNNTNSPTKEARAASDAEGNPERKFIWIKDAASSYNPAPMPLLPTGLPRAATKPPVNHLQPGDLTSAGHFFTPIQALAKYPYKFCNKDHMQAIASWFFAHGKFWEREWDLYYVWDVKPTKPVILVRESQVYALLKEINDHLKLALRITNQQREEGLVSCFPDHPRCLPRYLGRSHSREDYDNMVENTPNDMFRAAGEPSHPPLEGHTLEDFKQQMEELADIQKAKNKATRAKRQLDRHGKQRSMADQFKRTQRYLGLRPGMMDVTAQPPSLGAVDPMSPAPFIFDQSVVFVCVDAESYERAHHKITEIGVATLDTRELIGVAPGIDGANWRNLIRARHFRVNEYRHLVNTDFVTGCPDNFDFGQSTLVNLEDAALHVAACFHPPFGAHHSNGVSDIATLMSNTDVNEKRNIIFLGHDTLGDVKYLQQLGYDPMMVENILEALDTSVMYRVWRREQQPTSLGKILLAFDIPGFHLHNAGNDAAFTVQAMLAICVREAAIRGSTELDNMRSEEKAIRLAAAMDDAKQRVEEEAEGWSDHEAEGDGGAPVPLSANDAPKPAPAQVNSFDLNSRGNGRGNGRGRGRGRGGPTYDYPISSDTYRGGGYRGSGRGQLNGRGRGSNSGRGGGYVDFSPQATYHW
ncbi:uncharacterized protein K460DRAFT_404802 [Cucurbitaria berberidis CBS 394.84]|uniref:Gfd2/YDR514C-like C-terminal domain-containing protein n=1 Tax=Cucurbitaria berberidis CBS 394.84 TaxID=1168544 RepID=A0A9P4L7N4_9PLEO|nr:uncharacterized protein K460DRAFT_404802 [Cucurbitaria berberidis CBS 394.84]KAF1844507.1 hypothetical protein K460DRAFT_404802 [Cucurbitaria berberidis CBS 394.84]